MDESEKGFGLSKTEPGVVITGAANRDFTKVLIISTAQAR